MIIEMGVAALDEPTARALLDTMRRGVQVILTTHGLELIDMLVEEATPEALPALSLFTLALEDGELRSGRLAGHQIAAARAVVAEDLRRCSRPGGSAVPLWQLALTCEAWVLASARHCPGKSAM